MRAFATRMLTLVVGTTLAMTVQMAVPGTTLACSCMAPQPMAAYAGDPNQVIFSGTVQPIEARGVPVLVSQWFQGPGAAAVVGLDPSGFNGDGASCGISVFPAGTEWIFVAWRQETGELVVNLCSPHAMLSTPEGQAMLADAVTTFGGGGAPTPGPVSPGPDAPGAPVADTNVPIIALGLIVGGGVLAFGAVVYVMSRRKVGEGE
jgi:hypothetical protein